MAFAANISAQLIPADDYIIVCITALGGTIINAALVQSRIASSYFIATGTFLASRLLLHRHWPVLVMPDLALSLR